LYKPIQNFGLIFIGISIIGFCYLYSVPNSGMEYTFLLFFLGGLSILHLLLGIGIIRRNKKVFVLFKGYLKCLAIGFPVGTYISKKTLTYIDTNNIESYLE
jgi:hypothetical protein